MMTMSGILIIGKGPYVGVMLSTEVIAALVGLAMGIAAFRLGHWLWKGRP